MAGEEERERVSSPPSFFDLHAPHFQYRPCMEIFSRARENGGVQVSRFTRCPTAVRLLISEIDFTIISVRLSTISTFNLKCAAGVQFVDFP